MRGVEGRRVLTDGGAIEVEWVVDASGLAGARLLRDGPGATLVEARHLCAAAQEVRRVRDVAAAREFFARHGASPGEVLCFTGVAGGFSVVNVHLRDDEVGILTGSVPADGHPSGKALLERFVAEQRWIGARIFGGARAIPLRRPLDRLTDGRVALLGDAASQVFPAHGSGIGVGLVAARMLADALARGDGLDGWQVAWQREWGGLLASYDLFRRFSQTLTVADLERMMRAGLLDPALARSGLEQRYPRLGPDQLFRMAAAFTREPGLSARLLRIAGAMLTLRALYAHYPRDRVLLTAWSRAVASLFGERLRGRDRNPVERSGHTSGHDRAARARGTSSCQVHPDFT